MEKMKTDKAKQTLIKELLKNCKLSKSFWNLAQANVKNLFNFKVNKASEWEGRKAERAKVVISKEPTVASLEEWLKIRKEKELVDEALSKKALKMRIQGVPLKDVQSCLQKLCEEKMPVESILNAIDSVVDELKEKQSKPLEETYHVLQIEKVDVKIKEKGRVRHKIVYIANGFNCIGKKEVEVLGLWITKKRNKAFWDYAMARLKKRGVKKIYWAFAYNLEGFEEAVREAFPLPHVSVELCFLQLMSAILKTIPSHEDRKEMIDYLNPIYEGKRSYTTILNLLKRMTFEYKYPTVVDILNANWEGVIKFCNHMDSVSGIRENFYSKEMIGFLLWRNTILRRIVKKMFFPSDETALKWIFLILKNVRENWMKNLSKEALESHFYLSVKD